MSFYYCSFSQYSHFLGHWIVVFHYLWAVIITTTRRKGLENLTLCVIILNETWVSLFQTTGKKNCTSLRSTGLWGGEKTPHHSFESLPPFLQLKNKFMKKIPRDAEASNVLIGEVDFLDKPFVSFVRLAQATTLGGLTEVPVPTR